ncbi:MAG: RES family NAD+ phosphorylase, partial [Actinobacteria bacterium]|nr:RES family NAD+ phosphorylase [Actinomycetota bacterium]
SGKGLPSDAAAVDDIPPRVLSRVVWHQTRPRNALLDFADPAYYDARYSRAGEPGVWYASLTERAAWAELFRHWGQGEISPFEIRRRVGRVRVTGLDVLDLTDLKIQQRVGLDQAQLVANDWTLCQEIAARAQAAGFEGILAPSGALVGETTLVVFAAGMGKVVAEHSRVQRPPVRMLDVLDRIRLPDAAVEPVGRLYDALTSLSRRLRRR